MYLHQKINPSQSVTLFPIKKAGAFNSGLKNYTKQRNESDQLNEYSEKKKKKTSNLVFPLAYIFQHNFYKYTDNTTF